MNSIQVLVECERTTLTKTIAVKMISLFDDNSLDNSHWTTLAYTFPTHKNCPWHDLSGKKLSGWELSRYEVFSGDCPGGNCPIGMCSVGIVWVGFVLLGGVQWGLSGWELSGERSCPETD